MRSPNRLILCVASCAVALTAPAGAADPGAKAGKYRGKTQGHYTLSFSVKPGSKSIAGFRTALVVYCVSGIAPAGPTVKSVTLPKIKLAPSGKFDRTFTTKTAGTKLVTRVRGNIDHGVLAGGRLTYVLTGDGIECKTDSPQPFSARHL